LLGLRTSDRADAARSRYDDLRAPRTPAYRAYRVERRTLSQPTMESDCAEIAHASTQTAHAELFGGALTSFISWGRRSGKAAWRRNRAWLFPRCAVVHGICAHVL